jgi:zinc-ribbon domain
MLACGGHEMLCPECGSQVADGQKSCPECHFQIPKPGLLRRLRDFFGGSRIKTFTTSRMLENLIFVDRTTGKRQVFNSLDEVPAEIRAKIQEAQAKGGIISRKSSVVFMGSDGQEYHSLDEMPPQIRAMYEQVILPEIRAKLAPLGIETESSDTLT